MDTLKDILVNHGRTVGVCVAALVSGGIIYRFMVNRRQGTVTFTPRVCGKDYPRDTIILHMLPPDRQAPSLGHFVMKLATYLRVNNIKYQVDCARMASPKGKIPWIEYNGTSMGDSQFIIQFLEKEFNLDLNSHLTKQERAVAWAIQKWLEEFTYWLNVHTRWVIMFDTFFDHYQTAVSGIFRNFLKNRGKFLTEAVGVGRHTDEEVKALMVNDLRQFSEILGDKRYIMGDRISDVDCAAFGVLSQVRWCTPDDCPGKQLLTGGELQNVTDYLDRIRQQYWPDWDELCDKRNSS